MRQSTLTPPVSSIHPQSRSERIRLTRAATGLKPAEKLLLRSLVDFMGNATECWPSLSRLADEVGCSIRHVRRMLRSLEAAGWIIARYRFRPDRSQTSCVFQWVKAPDLHVRPPRTSASALEFNIGSIQESNTYAAPAECDFRKEDRAPVAADPGVNCPQGRANCPQATVAAELVEAVSNETPAAPDSVPVNCPEQNGTAPVAADIRSNCPEADPVANWPEGKENLPDSIKGPVNWPEVKGKENCPDLKPVDNWPYLSNRENFPDSGPVNCPEATGKAPDSVSDNCHKAPVAAELVEVDASNDGSKQGPSNEAPSAPAAPAIRSRKPSPKFIVIDGSKFLDINHGRDIYLAAVAAKLLNSGTVDRLAFFACWCAIAAKLRAGKVQFPERMMRFLLDNRKAMSAYPDHAAELKAREAVRFLFPEKPYNPHC